MNAPASKIRILEAITPSRIGGAEVFVADACEKLSGLGAHVELFCPAGRPFVDYAGGRGISAVTWKTRGKLDPLTVVRLARLIRGRGIDVVHTHLSTASLLGAFAAKLAGAPSVAHVHGFNTATCFKHSTLIIAVSEGVKEHLQAQGIRENKLRVVHNGVDLARFVPVPIAGAKRKFGLSDNAPVFGVFGRLSDEKGQRVAVEAMFLVLREHPRAQLIVAGDGRDEDDLKASVDALGIRENVRLTGFVRDVPELMSACDVVVVPSVRGEGFGLTAIEAMALRRPVVASELGGLKEIVVPNETGLLVPPGDPQAAAEAMAELIEDRSLAESMATRGRARVEERFDQDKQMGLVLSVLHEAAQ